RCEGGIFLCKHTIPRKTFLSLPVQAKTERAPKQPQTRYRQALPGDFSSNTVQAARMDGILHCTIWPHDSICSAVQTARAYDLQKPSVSFHRRRRSHFVQNYTSRGIM